MSEIQNEPSDDTPKNDRRRPIDPGQAIAALLSNAKVLWGLVGSFIMLVVTITLNTAAAWKQQMELPQHVEQLRLAGDSTHRAILAHVDSADAKLSADVLALKERAAAGEERDRMLTCVAREQIEGRDPSGCLRWLENPNRYSPPPGP